MESDSQQVIQKLNFRVSLLTFSNFLLYFLLFGDSCIILAFIPTYFTHKTLSISDKSGACSLWLHSLWLYHQQFGSQWNYIGKVVQILKHLPKWEAEVRHQFPLSMLSVACWMAELKYLPWTSFMIVQRYSPSQAQSME